MTTADSTVDPIHPTRLEEVNLLDPAVQNCPFHSYEVLRKAAPVWHDPRSGFYFVSRYDLLRELLIDTKRFSNVPPPGQFYVNPERTARIRALYEEKGWVPTPSLVLRDDPNHKQLRRPLEKAFRAGRIKEMDPHVAEISYQLIDGFIGEGKCEWVRQFAVPLPLMVIFRQVGARTEDMWKVKAWTDAWVRRLGMMQTEEEERWSTEMEIEMQHYFQPIFERLRKEPDATLLSDLVNTVIPEWGRTLTDAELHAEMMADIFVGGSETTANSLAAGVKMLIENPGVWRQLKSDPDKYLRNFVEEVVRLDGPVQFLLRYAAEDTELGGVKIPKDATLLAAYGAANRDESHFACPDKLDLDRSNSGSHLGYGSGIHHCLGAPLARRELYWGFKALVDRIEDMWFEPGRNDFAHMPSLLLRSIKELHIEFTAKGHGERGAPDGTPNGEHSI